MFQLVVLRASFNELSEKIHEMYNWPIPRGPLKHEKLNSTLDQMDAQIRQAKEEAALDADLLKHLQDVITYARKSERVGWISWNDKIAKNLGRGSHLSPTQREAVKLDEAFCESVEYVRNRL